MKEDRQLFMTSVFRPSRPIRNRYERSDGFRTDGLQVEWFVFDKKIKKGMIEKELEDIANVDDRSIRPKKFVGIDPGDAWIVGACAVDVTTGERSNFAIRRGTMNQPLTVARQSLEYDKSINPEIQNSESAISSLLDRLKNYDTLTAFYDSVHRRSQRWKSKKDRKRMFQQTVHMLLKMAGLKSNRQPTKEERDSVVFLVGLGEFKTKGPSTYSVFTRFLIKTVRSLGLHIFGVDEHLTSQKCPACLDQLTEITFRLKKCDNCKKHFHREKQN